MPVPLEKDIQKAILDYLAAKHVWRRRLNSGGARLPGRNGKSQLVRFGAPGMPDILARSCRGHVVWIEVKRPDGKQSPEQEKWETESRAFGDIYILARCVEDVMRYFEGGAGK